MKRSTSLLLLTGLATAAFLAGGWRGQHAAAGSPAAAGRKILYYTDPMHPSYRSDKPGTAPDCGMALEPVYEGGAEPAQPGAVKIDNGKQQLAGMKVGQAERVSEEYAIRLFGRVAADEARIYKLNAGSEGYIDTVSEATTGSRVKRDQVLATFSTPMAVMPIQTYLLNLDTADQAAKATASGSADAQLTPAVRANIQQRVQQLRNLGMSNTQMEELKRTREFPEGIHIVAPSEGVILARNVSPGQKFERGAEWYRIADLSKIWVMADVFEGDAAYVHAGMQARVAVPGRGSRYTAVVSAVVPQFDPNSRTLKVRLEMDNPEYALRPDMFVDVELATGSARVIAVPADAVFDSGLRKTVFVEVAEGSFEPRDVETGRRFGGRIEVVRGLSERERFVETASFLLDSETRMKESVRSVDAETKDPVCGMKLQRSKAGAQGEYHGVTHYFCSQTCKDKFTGENGTNND